MLKNLSVKKEFVKSVEKFGGSVTDYKTSLTVTYPGEVGNRPYVEVCGTEVSGKLNFRNNNKSYIYKSILDDIRKYLENLSI